MSIFVYLGLILTVLLSAENLFALCPGAPSLYQPTNTMEFQECVSAANTDGVDSTIDLGNNIFTFTDPFATINALPVILNDNTLTIQNGTIERDPTSAFIFRFFEISALMTAGVTFSNLVMRDGNVGSGTNSGGAVLNQGNITSINNVRFERNIAYTGGAIAMRSGQIASITNSAFISNIQSSSAAFVSSSGGAIFISEAHIGIIDNSLFIGNEADRGGAISVTQAASINIINNTEFQENLSGFAGAGGAISLLQGSVTTINDTTFSRNRATAGGGAISLQGSAIGRLSNSTFDRNVGAGFGGGILIITSGTPSNISILVNSTFNLNEATGEGSGGGAIAFSNAAAALTSAIPSKQQAVSTIGILSNTTIAGNRAAANGGGISLNGVGNIPILSSTIIALNSAPTGPDVYEPVDDGVGTESFNLISNNADSFFIAGLPNQNNSYVGTAANPILAPQVGLEPLAHNGGRTQTMALMMGSLPEDHGANPLNELYDQRGPIFLRTSGPQTDIGAFELQQALPPCPPCICPECEVCTICKICPKCKICPEHQDDDEEDSGHGGHGGGGPFRGPLGANFIPIAVATPVPVPVVTPAPGDTVIAAPVPAHDAAHSGVSSSTTTAPSEAGGCSSLSGTGTASTNLIFIFLGVLFSMRTKYLRRKPNKE